MSIRIRMAAKRILLFAVSLCLVTVIVDTICNYVENCVDCQKYGSQYNCTQCEDRYYINSDATCSACQNNCVTCVSIYNCSLCMTGYYGTWCSLTCDSNCVQPECYQYNGTCVHGCPAGYYQAGSRCDKCYIQYCEECSGPYHCARCSSGYNLWSSDSSTYCDIGCPPGTWGDTCQYNCSSSCSDTRCNKTNGHCYRCTRNAFGETCQFLCSEGCDGGIGTNVCDKENGNCLFGCKPKYTGIYCEKSVNSVDGQWGQWSGYGPCSVTCGSGSRSRTRSCDNPEPQIDGQNCIGDNIQTIDCNVDICQVDGQWSQWTEYGPCSATCDWGSRSRTRSCDQPEPQNGGQTCSGRDEETTDCYLMNCSPIIGNRVQDIQYEAADDNCVASLVGGVFGGTAVGFVGGLLLGHCIYKRKCLRRGQKSSNHDNTLTPPTVTYVNIADTTDGVPVPGIQGDVPAYESLDRKSGPDQVYTGLKTGTR